MQVSEGHGEATAMEGEVRPLKPVASVESVADWAWQVLLDTDLL